MYASNEPSRGGGVYALIWSVFQNIPVFGCRWSQTYGESGHFSVWIQTPEATANPNCTHNVDKAPNNANLRECTILIKNTGWWLWVTSSSGHGSCIRDWVWMIWGYMLAVGEHVSMLRTNLWSTLCLIASAKRRITGPVHIVSSISWDTMCIDQIRHVFLKRDKRKAFFCLFEGLALSGEDCGKYIRECGRIRA